MRCARSSKLPAQPTQKRMSAVSPLAASSAIVGIFIAVCFSSHRPPPICPVGLCIFPWRTVIFHVVKHRIQACGCLRLFHHGVTPQLDDNLQWVDVYGAGFHTCVAGGASPYFLAGNVVVEERFAIIGPTVRSEEHTSELQSRENLVCSLL